MTKMSMFSRRSRRPKDCATLPLKWCSLATHIFKGAFRFAVMMWEFAAYQASRAERNSTLTVEPGTSYLLNPGSIGQPRDGDARAAFAIADLENRSVEFWRVPYDIEDVQQRMSQAGLPEPLILRLSFGR